MGQGYYGLQLLSAFGIFAFLGSCGPTNDTSSTSDIFNNDHLTRHRATSTELQWTIKAKGCTASALNTRYILIANHCRPTPGQRFTSGPATAARRLPDMEVVQVVESSASYDYAILAVRWLRGRPTKGQKYTPYIATAEDAVELGPDSSATKLFTVGFPADKRGVGTYAEGFAKGYTDRGMLYNIGTINGNSGGAVWIAESKTLVSMTNAGSKSFGAPGWNNNRPEDAMHWNSGAAMYKVYAQSRILKSIFKDGDNVFVDEKGDLEPASITSAKRAVL